MTKTWNKGLKGYNKDYPRSKEWCFNISKSKKGHTVSEEARKKISEKQKGRISNRKGVKLSEKTKSKLRKANLGKRLSEETIRKMKETSRIRGVNKGKKNGMFGKMSGSKNINWKGGITPENAKIRTSIEYRLWREAVFARDNWTCQKYGIKGGKLHAHHILDFSEHSELRTSISNGITLSDKAHKEFHKKYGKTNNTREQLEEFLFINIM